jgi:type I restriction enzyme M protein
LIETAKRGDTPSASVFLTKASGHGFYSKSAFTVKALMGDPASIKPNLTNYIRGFSGDAETRATDDLKQRAA